MGYKKNSKLKKINSLNKKEEPRVKTRGSFNVSCNRLRESITSK